MYHVIIQKKTKKKNYLNTTYNNKQVFKYLKWVNNYKIHK